jgi:hypothetical protein
MEKYGVISIDVTPPIAPELCTCVDTCGCGSSDKCQKRAGDDDKEAKLRTLEVDVVGRLSDSVADTTTQL